MTARLVAIEDGQFEVLDWGSGEPVVFVQTALTADELLPLASEVALAEGYRKVVYHRRGYAGSSPAAGPRSIVGEAADARALLATLGVERAHVVGVSFSSAIALQLAADAPDCTHSLTLAEPPPVHTSRGPEFRVTNERLLRTRREQGVDAALEEFLTLLVGPNWREQVEVDLPGAVAQIERDAATFFDTDIPALLDWQFDSAEAGRISCLVLYVGGSESPAWFADVRDLVLGLVTPRRGCRDRGGRAFPGGHPPLPGGRGARGVSTTPPARNWLKALTIAWTGSLPLDYGVAVAACPTGRTAHSRS